MNWKEIKEKYPKGFGETFNYTNRFPGLSIDVTDRWLYDFFDEQNFNVAVLPFFNSWIWKIRYEDMNFVEGEKKESTRTEAEEQAFTRAFEILEEKLK